MREGKGRGGGGEGDGRVMAKCLTGSHLQPIKVMDKLCLQALPR